MPRFKVMVFRCGEWDKEDPRDVDAANETEAAEKVCGPEPLGETGHHGKLRAELWRHHQPTNKKYFYQT
jgi:hypothetical protein